MKKLEEFKTMEELLKYRKELETLIADEDLLDEVVDNVWKELLSINSCVRDIYSTKNTNSKWLAIILTLLSSRSYKDKYKIKVVNTSNSKEKVYTLDDDLHHATVEENNTDKEHNVVLFTNENGKNIIYDEFDGKFDMDSYLSSEVPFSMLINFLENKGLNEKEIRTLNKFVFDSYKEGIIKGKIKVRKCD